MVHMICNISHETYDSYDMNIKLLTYLLRPVIFTFAHLVQWSPKLHAKLPSLIQPNAQLGILSLPPLLTKLNYPEMKMTFLE